MAGFTVFMAVISDAVELCRVKYNLFILRRYIITQSLICLLVCLSVVCCLFVCVHKNVHTPSCL